MFLTRYISIIGFTLFFITANCQTVSKEFIKGKWKGVDTIDHVTIIFEFVNDSDCTQTIINPTI